MRNFCCLASLYLLQIVFTGAAQSKDELIQKNEKINTGKTEALIFDKSRDKRDTRGHARRGQRQVGYFETSGENICENEFVTQDIRGPGIRYDEKIGNGISSPQGLYEQEGESGVENSANLNEEEVNGNNKFQLFNMNEDTVDSDDIPFRKERQIRRFESSADVLRGPDKPEVNKNFINLLRWNKNKESLSDLFPPGVQKNEAYPVNDDVADFAVYMNKTNKKKNRTRTGGLGLGANIWDRKIHDQTEDNELTQDNFDHLKQYKSDWHQNSEKNSDNNYSVTGSKMKDDTVNIVDDFLFPSDDENIWDKPKSSKFTKNAHKSFASISSLIKSASVKEAESDDPDSERQQDSSSSVVGDVVREKTITLPEPLVFNSSHVVASFVYTMIPFRSPLLNLLENDKHSKYIMIKIDPVLQPSKRITMNDQQLKGDNIEYTLERNVMRVIDKLIGSDFQWDFNSVEGQPRSKQKYKLPNTRYHRRSESEPTSKNHSSKPDLLKRFNGVIS